MFMTFSTRIQTGGIMQAGSAFVQPVFSRESCGGGNRARKCSPSLRVGYLSRATTRRPNRNDVPPQLLTDAFRTRQRGNPEDGPGRRLHAASTSGALPGKPRGLQGAVRSVVSLRSQPARDRRRLVSAWRRVYAETAPSGWSVWRGRLPTPPRGRRSPRGGRPGLSVFRGRDPGRAVYVRQHTTAAASRRGNGLCYSGSEGTAENQKNAGIACWRR